MASSDFENKDRIRRAPFSREMGKGSRCVVSEIGQKTVGSSGGCWWATKPALRPVSTLSASVRPIADRSHLSLQLHDRNLWLLPSHPWRQALATGFVGGKHASAAACARAPSSSSPLAIPRKTCCPATTRAPRDFARAQLLLLHSPPTRTSALQATPLAGTVYQARAYRVQPLCLEKLQAQCPVVPQQLQADA